MKATAQSQVKTSSTSVSSNGVPATAGRGITNTVELVTPEVAAKMLERNTANRPISSGIVAKYAEDMRANRWDYNGQDIIFSETGDLLDGQHRLSAIIAAETPTVLGIKRGLPSSAFATLDAGKSRTAGDILALLGVPSYNHAAGVARIALSYATGRAFRGGTAGRVTRREITDYALAHPYINDCVRLAAPLIGRLTLSPAAAVLFLANERRFFDDQIAEFVEGVATGEGLEKGDPRLALREWAINERLRHRGQIVNTACFAAVARAWNAYSRGEDLKLIKIVRNPTRETLEIVGFYAPVAA